MNIKVENYQNPNILGIHVTRRLLHGMSLCFDDSDTETLENEFNKGAINPEALMSFCRAVNELDGIQGEISFHRYYIQVKKASTLFSWQNITPHVLEAVRVFIEDNGCLVKMEEEVSAPMHSIEEPPKHHEHHA